MDAKTIAVSVVSIAIACLFAVTVLIPVISESTTTEDTFKNKGVYYMTDDTTDYVLGYHGTTGDFYLGETLICNRSDLPIASWTLVSTPEYLVRLQNFNAQNYSLWVIGMDGTNRVLGTVETESVTVTVTEDTIIIDNNSYSFSYSGNFRGIATSGDYVMTNGTDKPIVHNNDSVIVGNGTTTVDHWYDMFYINGTVEEMDVDAPTGITISDVTVNVTELNDYKDASKVNSVTFTAFDGEDTSVDATYDRVIVPYEVTLERSIYPDESTNAMLNLIPLLVIVGIIIGTVGIIAFRR